MEQKRRTPLGIELVRRGLITEDDISIAINYQKEHPNKKIGDILNILKLCDSKLLLDAMGEIMGEKTILLRQQDLKINPLDYVSSDVAKKNKAIPFEITGGKIKVCFADSSDRKAIETIKLILLNKGLIMDRYISFESNVDFVLRSFEGVADDNININKDTIGLVDSIIKTAMEKRASDIHFEPSEKNIRVRYRIDGELINITNIPKEKQEQITGRIKAISNMHQEKQEAQDGRIVLYPDYNIRVSTQKNIYGEKIVLRLLKKNLDIKRIFELGFPNDDKLIKKCFNKRNSIVIVAAPTGEGKTTTLYSIIDYLDSPHVNITTIEDPVEIRIPTLNQIEIDAKTTFSDSLRTVLRQDPDIILVGEIRDNETAEIAMQAGQTGHYVLSTIHTIDSIEVITRLRKLGVSNFDIASTLATSISQRLVRKICPHCAKKREFTEEEKKIITEAGQKYGEEFDFKDKFTYEVIGCQECNNTGYYDRIGVFETLLIDDCIKEEIVKNASSFEIRKVALQNGYKPLVIDGLNKVLNGITTLDELNKKLVIF